MEPTYEIYLDTLCSMPLFAGFSRNEIRGLVQDLNAIRLSCIAGQTIREHRSDRPEDTFLLVLSGTVHLVRYDELGNRHLIDCCFPGEVLDFGRFPKSSIPGSVYVAGSRCDILKLLNPSQARIPEETRTALEANLLNVLMVRIEKLLKKIDVMTRSSVREKILTYLAYEKNGAGSNSFDIPLNRQELAEHLFIDRTTLSAALTHLSDEGILKTRKHHFELYSDPLAGNEPINE